MNDYTIITKRYTIWTTVLIIIFVLIALLLTESAFFLGLALGSVFSLLNLWTTYTQVERIGKSFDEGKKSRVGIPIGTLTRILSAIIAVLIATAYPAVFSLTGVIIGLMITYIMIMIEPLFHIKRL